MSVPLGSAGMSRIPLAFLAPAGWSTERNANEFAAARGQGGACYRPCSMWREGRTGMRSRLAASTIAVLVGLAGTLFAPKLAGAATGTASLAVTITPGTTSIVKGVPTRFTVSVTNQGPDAAPNTTARIVLLSNPGTFSIKFPANTSVSSRMTPYADWPLGTVKVGATATNTVTITGLVITGSTTNANPATLGVEMSTSATNPLQYDDRSGTFSRHIQITTVRVAASPSPTHASTSNTPTPTASHSPTQIVTTSRSTTTAAVSANRSTRPAATVHHTPTATATSRTPSTASSVLVTPSDSPAAARPTSQKTAGLGRWMGLAAVLAAAAAATRIVLLRRRGTKP